MNVAPFVARENAGVRDRKIATQIARYAWRHRATVFALAARHPRLADLALSFPGLLFALAVPRRRFDPAPVIERAILGAQLGELATAAHMPGWLRKLGPEAFQHPIPWLPDSQMFRRQIANHLPASSKLASQWLSIVSAAGYWGHEALAIWFARRVGNRQDREALDHLALLSLWAWHSANPSAPAARWVTRAWRPEISTRQAVENAIDWKWSVIASLEMSTPIADPWAEPAVVDGFAFTPITSSQELIHVALRFRNCIRTHARNVGSGWERLWLIRRADKDVAILSLGDRCVPSVQEISGPENRDVIDEVALAAHRWVRLYCPVRILPAAPAPRAAGPGWIALWRDYWLDKRRFPRWLPPRAPDSFHQWLEPRTRMRKRRLLRDAHATQPDLVYPQS